MPKPFTERIREEFKEKFRLSVTVNKQEDKLKAEIIGDLWNDQLEDMTDFFLSEFKKELSTQKSDILKVIKDKFAMLNTLAETTARNEVLDELYKEIEKI